MIQLNNDTKTDNFENTVENKGNKSSHRNKSTKYVNTSLHKEYTYEPIVALSSFGVDCFVVS